jgi:hypothetical protein
MRLRVLWLALLLALLTGLAIGTWLRLRLERPERYIGGPAAPAGSESAALGRADSGRAQSAPCGRADSGRPAGSAITAEPLHVGDAGAAVLDAGEHEEQVGEAVEEAERGRRDRLAAAERHGLALRAPADGASQVEGGRGGRAAG